MQPLDDNPEIDFAGSDDSTRRYWMEKVARRVVPDQVVPAQLDVVVTLEELQSRIEKPLSRRRLFREALGAAFDAITPAGKSPRIK